MSQWEETWGNLTGVDAKYRERVEINYREERNSTSGRDVTRVNYTFLSFSTVADASEFVKNGCIGWNQPSENTTAHTESLVYNETTGHYPSVFLYCYISVSGGRSYSLFQLDDIVIYKTTIPANYTHLF
jgi:hypothetical protein